MIKDIVTGVCRGAKRGVLTSKQGRNFYKGNRSGSMGRHTKHGSYVIDWSKLKPYVSHRTPKISSPMPTPEEFLDLNHKKSE
ncbi:54S ribosomal protein L27, mitochondrial [Zancudomyces culisetae]|uniref:54S ribosomal protein L27, mitochondrial n=1 Tax=Zancudomyces culisetae TaxID=1213189 RepID=A0A1R1PYC5_ZANCU|nr:54S ribosomal protein L27, mitochondrial [Zancudomyces culisetae]|eukprot:OMH85907.1 54S ribosomal protein L27, mitochondrial [Zancudomyces culisetae]